MDIHMNIQQGILIVVKIMTIKENQNIFVKKTQL